jgi:two-component system, NtrC family, response regulator AtoC
MCEAIRGQIYFLERNVHLSDTALMDLQGTSENKPRPDLREALPPGEVIFGSSPAMESLRIRVQKVCYTNVQVLLCGDPGTGKEVLARWIHAHSTHANGNFVSMNCAAIPSALLESELFGYEKGAFTGAGKAKPGKCLLADNGTLFLDEIADLEWSLQSKLLHFLQDGCISPIGGELEIKINARIICATSRDLEQQIAAGKFRSDLYYRINVVQLRLPRLRERKEDIPLLAEHLREHYAKKFGKNSEPLSVEMLKFLQEQSWPGNLRELANCIARHVLIGPDAAIMEDHLSRRSATSTWPAGRAGCLPLKRIAKEAIRELERNMILGALRENHWNRRETAKALKISYRALMYKIRAAGFSSGRNGSDGHSRSTTSE